MAVTVHASGISTQSGTGALTHTISALTAGRQLIVLNDSTGNGYTDGPTGITGVTIGGNALTRIGYRYVVPGSSAGITSCYVRTGLGGGETAIAVSSDAGGFWQSDIVWTEVSGLDGLLDVENSTNAFDVALSVGFTTGYSNSLGISCGAGGTPSSSGWSNVTGSTTAAINADLGTAGAETLAFVDLGSPAGRNVAVYAIRASATATPSRNLLTLGVS